MISVHDLSVTYRGGIQALRRTNLRFKSGEFTVLLGSSGAGKSTLLRSLNGLVRPSSGKVEVEGLGDIADARHLAAHRRRTGMVFQQHQLIGRLSVLANVLTGRLGYHGSFRTLLPFSATEKRLGLESTERVGLLEFALRRADELSGGQQQRVGIARAIVQEPRLILADEPVASLDPATAQRVLGLLHRICKADGLTAVVSLHQLGFARTYADRIVALAGGQVVFDGPPSGLGDREVARVYGTSPPTAATVTQIDFPARTGTYA